MTWTGLEPEHASTVLEVRRLKKNYGSGDAIARILADVTFDVQAGEFVCVVGPSGSGKTTLLRSIAGLQAPTDGAVIFEGDTVTEPPRKMAVIFQDYSRSLLPWMTVAANVELPMRNKFDKAERYRRVEEVLVSVGLAGKGDLYPWQMSGGMQQRAAIARGIAYQPDVLLMDEPSRLWTPRPASNSKTLCCACGRTIRPPSCSSPTTSTKPSTSPTESSCSPARRPRSPRTSGWTCPGRAISSRRRPCPATRRSATTSSGSSSGPSHTPPSEDRQNVLPTSRSDPQRSRGCLSRLR
ncbi:ABC transporter ATP-binding subunit [Rhodococcus opacus M213]|uniref:ABC transporter ATP-binding subunit n=1 Tax=Rhodococcus opacus M213 TaxID=1129896 RepID=K8XSY0_RHOOP|nr:ABC transporter ATP-binding subunit [Rhodococcus opacus M213]